MIADDDILGGDAMEASGDADGAAADDDDDDEDTRAPSLQRTMR